ncbi:MAG: hypothetical protein JRF45_04330 [Deltaproteobacteria bacterium]|nr:hypothetical protein [Deltaproteobacteria bacterium]
MGKKTIGFVGPDGRTCMCAYTVSTVESEKYIGAIIKGMTGMGPVMDAVRGKKNWTVKIFPIEGKAVEDYKTVIIEAFENGEIDYIVIMPEDLIYEGIVDELIEAGYDDRCLLHLSRWQMRKTCSKLSALLRNSCATTAVLFSSILTVQAAKVPDLFFGLKIFSTFGIYC